MLTIHAVMTLLALLLLRVAVQIALLHECTRSGLVHRSAAVRALRACGSRHGVLPACGAATRASSRTSRADRRRSRPVRTVATEGQ
jgi:hypothetical protein